MHTIARLFGKSPFTSLQAHMRKVAECVYGLRPLMEAVRHQNSQALRIAVEQIVQAEYEADQVKNDTRNQLQSGLMMPITRASLLELLSIQDALANHAKEVALTYTLRILPLLPCMEALFLSFFEKQMSCFDGVKAVIEELDRLLETSFGGHEATKVADMVSHVVLCKQEVDQTQQELLALFLAQPEAEQATYLFLSMKVIDSIAAIANEAERLAHRIRMLLEVA